MQRAMKHFAMLVSAVPCVRHYPTHDVRASLVGQSTSACNDVMQPSPGFDPLFICEQQSCDMLQTAQFCSKQYCLCRTYQLSGRLTVVPGWPPAPSEVLTGNLVIQSIFFFFFKSVDAQQTEEKRVFFHFVHLHSSLKTKTNFCRCYGDFSCDIQKF